MTLPETTVGLDQSVTMERGRDGGTENAQEVPPRGTFNSSPVPSSYRTVFSFPTGVIRPYSVVTLGALRW